jgi:phage portal protein BeeE
VPPSKAFDLTKANYNTLEAEMLAYLTGTLRQYLVRVEGEINRKVFARQERRSVRAEFDTTELLRTDKKTQADYFRTMFSTGGITSNEIRRSQNLPRIEGGDRAFVQVNMYPLDGSEWGPKKREEIVVVKEDEPEGGTEDGNDNGDNSK